MTLSMTERTSHWLTHAKSALERDGRVTYSPLFYQILEIELDGYFTASELARLLIKNDAKHDSYRLEVGQRAQRFISAASMSCLYMRKRPNNASARITTS